MWIRIRIRNTALDIIICDTNVSKFLQMSPHPVEFAIFFHETRIGKKIFKKPSYLPNFAPNLKKGLVEQIL